MVQNTESNGRFHTDWLNMIYPRLRLAKDLLASNGVIFISIDNRESANLRKLCKDVNDETIKAIAQKQPYYFVMRDSSMANDSVATNFEQIFATYSPDTVRKVL